MNLARTIPHVLEQAAQQWPDRIAIQDGEVQISFTQLQADSRAMAAAMMGSGLQFGDRFSIWAPNIQEWVATAIGGMMAGGILVPLNTRYRGLEAGDILRRSQSRLLFTTSGFLDTDYPAMLANEALPDLQQTILLRGDKSSSNTIALSEFLATTTNESVDERLSQISADSISDILFTSGTTGQPKGVLSSHGQTVEMFQIWSDTVGLSEQDRYLIVNPFFHSFGYKAGWLASVIQGATALPMAVFSADATLQLIEQEKINMLPGAPTIFQTLLASDQLANTDTSSLRCAVTGAASVPEQLVHDMKSVLGFDQVFTAYGLTECPVVSITAADDELGLVANTAGKALLNTEIQIHDESGKPLPANEVGEIKVKGYNVMQGYFNNQQATAESITEDGWLDTGDIGWMDENGYIKVTDRAKDMFICGGFNCYPAEIENLLLRHSNITDVAVVGEKEERLGEVGHAYLVSNSEELNFEELRAWAREHMANFKVPRQFTLVNELPRNASGKVQKFLLSELPNRRTLN